MRNICDGGWLMAKIQFSEKDLQDWLYKRLIDGNLADSITNLDESLQIARAYQAEPFVSDLNGFLFSMAKVRWAEGVEGIANWHSPLTEVSVAQTGGRPLQIDILAQTTRFGEFVVIELKRDRNTERQAVTELAAYANALSNIFPTLPPQRISLAVIATNWNRLLANALTLLAIFHRYVIVGLEPEVLGNSEELDFSLKIVDFPNLGSVRPKAIKLENIDYLSLKIIPEEVHPLTAHREITRHIRRLGLTGFCAILFKDDETAKVCAFLLNPYKLTESFLDSIDVKLLNSVLGLSDERSEDEFVQILSQLAHMWAANQVVEIFEPFRVTVNNITEVALPKVQVTGTLKSFLEKDYREWSIGNLQFAGIFEDFADVWATSHTALDLLQLWYGDLSGKQKLALILGFPDVKLFILSEFIEIGEFQGGVVSLLDIFRFGRRLGRLGNCAILGTEEEYDRECQIFLVSFARCPFKVEVDLANKSSFTENLDTIVKNFSEKIAVMSGRVFLVHLFMIGCLTESEYDSMLQSKGGYVVTNLDHLIDGMLRQDHPPSLKPIWTYLWENREKLTTRNSANQHLGFLNVFEQVLKVADEEIEVLSWFYENKETTFSLAERQKAKKLLQNHSKNLKYPVIAVSPLGNTGVSSIDDTVDLDEELRVLWESIDHQNEFISIDKGVGFGVMWAISYEDPSTDRVLKVF